MTALTAMCATSNALRLTILSQILVSFLLARPTATSSLHAHEPDDDEEHPCRLYLAQSHLYTDNTPKFALFAGVDFNENEVLPFPEIGIPMVDFIDGPWHDSNTKIFKYLQNFMWTGDYAGGAKWQGNHSTTMFIPGFGVLANYHAGTENVDWLQASTQLQHLSEDEEHTVYKPQPGKAHHIRGANAPYDNITMRATSNIKAGMELFASFGEEWDDANIDIYEQTLNRWDYIEADKVLNRMLDFFGSHISDLQNETLQEDIIDFVLDRILFTTNSGFRIKNIKSLIPTSLKKLKKAKELGGTFNYRNQDMVKSQKWLRKNAVCVDTLEVKPSTIPDAGRGAFATRSIDEGDRITISPMMMIIDDDLLNMYEIIATETEQDGKSMTQVEYDLKKPIGIQVLANYAIGHVESTLLLVPVGPMFAHINHGTPDKVNAVIDWSDHKIISNDDELHEKTVDELKAAKNPRIVMQVVATRDIEPGEEIFIDYGEEWQYAWDQHRESFEEAYPEGTWPLQGSELTVEYKDKPYPVDLKTDNHPYPPGVVTACYVMAKDMEDGRPRKNEEDEEIMIWYGPSKYEDFRGQDLIVCDLISRKEDPVEKYVYTVKGVMRGEDTDLVQIEGVPHSAIILTDSPYSADIFDHMAFRRWIAMDDSRFPQKWRNLR